MATTDDVAVLRGQLAIKTRWHPDDTEGIDKLRAELERARLRRVAKRCVVLTPQEMAEAILEGSENPAGMGIPAGST